MTHTKEELHYRFPTKCCGHCKWPYVSTYGDVQCPKLTPGNLIDMGAVCDSYESDGDETSGQIVVRD
jgi:hypothetical protein